MQNEIRIPDSRLETFESLAKLTDEAFKEFYAQATKLTSAYTEQAILTLGSEAKHISKTDFSKLIRLILTLFPPLIDSRKSINEF